MNEIREDAMGFGSICSRGEPDRLLTPGFLAKVNQASAFLQYCRHFTTSFTASDPAGTSYSSSTVAGIVHLFLLTSCRISRIGVSPVPHATFPAPCAGV